MRSLAALVFAFWVLVASPMLCMGDMLSHDCGCDKSMCTGCQAEDCQKSHRCHDYPCPDDLTRPDQNDSGIGSLIAADFALVDFADVASAVLDISGFVPLVPSEFVPEPSLATATIPLLI